MKLINIKNPARILVRTCLNVKKNESVLIITDKNKLTIAREIEKQAKKITDKVKLIIIPVGKIHGEEPPKEVAGEMLHYNVLICPTTMSLTHTKARVNACKKGARAVTLPGITEEVMQIIDIDYKKMNALTLKLKHILDKSKKIHITTPSGADITFSTTKRKWEPDLGIVHKNKEESNLPAGEIYIAPDENKTNGIIIIDSFKDDDAVYCKPKTRLIVKSNTVVYISDKKSRLSKIFNTVKNATNIAELGIGTNYKAKVIGNILEDEKCKGTVHIAYGNAAAMGGEVYSTVHLDCILFKPTIKTEHNIIMKDGKFLI